MESNANLSPLDRKNLLTKTIELLTQEFDKIETLTLRKMTTNVAKVRNKNTDVLSWMMK